MTSVLDQSDLEQFRRIVTRRFGLQYEDGRLDYLADVLRRRVEAAKSPRASDYIERLASSLKSSDELRALAEQVTVGETFFFRNPDNFRALAERVLPERLQSKRGEKRLRILSAGCASGEEPYTVAITVRETLPDPESWDVEIRGIDVNPSMLRKARRAEYSTWSLRSTPEDVSRRYFKPDEHEFMLDRTIRQMVTFEERNLVDEDPAFWAPRYDVVFCRNVMMYFTPDVMRNVVHRLHRCLLPGGFLFLGHAETLRGVSQDFNLQHTHGTFYYQRGGGAATAIHAPPSYAEPSDEIARVLPAVVDSTASWVDVIHHASERIASLADQRARPDATPQRRVGADVSLPVVARSWSLVLALEAMRQERFSDGLDLLSALPPDASVDPDALLLRAALLTNSGHLVEAEEVCRRLLAVDELSAGAHYLMALCREYAGDSAATVEHDQTAVYLDPGFAMPHLHLGLVARRSGDVATAREELGQALVLLDREDASRILLFGGGFSRQTLLQLCRAELLAAGGEETA